MPHKKTFDRPSPFSQPDNRKITLSAGSTLSADVGATGSLRDERPGIRSSQQLRVDWSRFEQHTFFNSARVKTNLSFDKIVNEFPFDAPKDAIEQFIDSLNGFEKHVYDRLPKNVGYLNFSASYLVTADAAGSRFPTLSRRADGSGVLDPVGSPLTVEMHLAPRTGSLGNSIVLQRTSGSDLGFTLFVSHSHSPLVRLSWIVNSGSVFVSSSGEIPRDSFTHIAAVMTRDVDIVDTKLYLNGALVPSSSGRATFGKLIMSPAELLIGTGSGFHVGNLYHKNDELFSGSIDELRIFSAERSETQIKRFARRELLSYDDLVLYYKFNEPTGTLGPTTGSSINQIVLDSSGRSLHTSITGTFSAFSFQLRNTGSLAIPMTQERRELSPVLFPAYKKLKDFNIELLASASDYDNENPNLITRLVPEHYFVEGQSRSGLSSIDGTLVEPYTGSSLPGSGELGPGQLLGSILYVWATMFDEVKLALDSISVLETVDYDEMATTPNSFLQWLAKRLGFDESRLFSNASVEQFSSGLNVGSDDGFAERSLLKIKHELLRRVLTNARDIIESKGTLHSLHAYLRAIGIDPQMGVRIRKLGGLRKRGITPGHEKRSLVLPMLAMSASNSLLTSSFLSGSRLEVGRPTPRGSFILKGQFPPHGMSDNLNDGFFTSGSWTVEAAYRFEPTASLMNTTQSLMRLCVLGDGFGTTFTTGVVMNVVAITGTAPHLKMFMRPGTDSADLPLVLMLSGADIFGGDIWNMSVTRQRGDQAGSSISASISFRCASLSPGRVQRTFITQSYFLEALGGMNVFSSGSPAMNASGTFIAIGSQSLGRGTTTAWRFLNNESVLHDASARAVTFDGEISRIRFWSRGFADDEWLEHAQNLSSVGVKDPKLNFGFVRNLSGSFERLRLDASMDQGTTASDSTGNIHILDMSQEANHMSASGLEPGVGIIKKLVQTSVMSPYFDEATADESVRIRSFTFEESLSGSLYARQGIISSLSRREEADDDPRLSIDLSLISALNNDMMNMFSSAESINDALGSPSSNFSEDYEDLESLREIHGNRLIEHVRLNDLTDLFRWFDGLIESGIKNLIPRKSVYLGTNVVIEPHVLERSRLQHKHAWSYLDESDRDLQPEIIDHDLDGGAEN